MYELRPVDVARLVFGLREDSRLMRKMCKQTHDLKELLLASIVDRVAWLCWTKTEDGHNNRNKPESIYNQLIGKKKEKRNETFSSLEEFEKRRKEIIEGSKEECQI